MGLMFHVEHGVGWGWNGLRCGCEAWITPPTCGADRRGEAWPAGRAGQGRGAEAWPPRR
ncbi:hypothetical protein [Lysobacter gummosus]|uniref:hypothetical protein n=1 Tax=Lysobacter gummosus TaxID=262324 RepID=UPI003626383A